MDIENNPVILERLKELSKHRKRVLAGPSEEALRTILDYQHPAALVHSFPAEDLHLMIHEIGMENCLPLLKLASNKQWEHILDIETWNKDRVGFQSLTGWLDRFLTAEPQRLAKWCFEEKLELIELFLFRNIEVRIREADQSPSDMGAGFFSDDDTYYVRLRDYPVAGKSEEKIKEKRNHVLTRLLQALSRYDHVSYQGLLLEAASLIPSETEEELFRLRNVRLAEKGFLPFHEAMGVYQPLRDGEIKSRGKKKFSAPPQNLFMAPVPSVATGLLDDENLFTRSLKSITETVVVLQLQTEFAGLCNQVASADQVIAKNRGDLDAIVKKVSGCLSMGLESLMEKQGPDSRIEGGILLSEYFLSDIFRTGYGRILKLKWRADKWRKESWFQSKGLPLSFWGEAWFGVLGGLLIEKPMFFLNNPPEQIYRDFQALQEIDNTLSVLDKAIFFDEIFSLLDCPIENLRNHPLFLYKNLLLTLWAGSHLKVTVKGPRQDQPIPVDQFRTFFDGLWETGPDSRHIGDAVKEDFLLWLAGATGIDDYIISKKIGDSLESLFKEIEEELAGVPVHQVDHRFINLFILDNAP